MFKTPATFAVLACLASLTPSQTVAGHFSPNPVAPGASVTFTGTDATGQGLNLSSPCGWYTIRQGSPTGQVVPLGLFCGQVIVPIPPNGTFSFSWNQRDANNALVPPGRYWVEARVWDASLSRQSSDFFAIEILPPGEPALTAPNQPRVGGSVPLAITAPMDPSAAYFTAMSLTSNNPIRVLGLDTCLSSPVFADLVTNPFGNLDPTGSATNLVVNIPNLRFLAHQGFHVQTLLFGPRGVKLTNDLSFTIQP